MMLWRTSTPSQLFTSQDHADVQPDLNSVADDQPPRSLHRRVSRRVATGLLRGLVIGQLLSLTSAARARDDSSHGSTGERGTWHARKRAEGELVQRLITDLHLSRPISNLDAVWRANALIGDPQLMAYKPFHNSLAQRVKLAERITAYLAAGEGATPSGSVSLEWERQCKSTAAQIHLLALQRRKQAMQALLDPLREPDESCPSCIFGMVNATLRLPPSMLLPIGQDDDIRVIVRPERLHQPCVERSNICLPSRSRRAHYSRRLVRCAISAYSAYAEHARPQVCCLRCRDLESVALRAGLDTVLRGAWV